MTDSDNQRDRKSHMSK